MAVLIFVPGHVPNTAFLNGQLTTDETGYVITEPRSTATNIAGVFAAGDVQDKIYRYVPLNIYLRYFGRGNM